MRRLRSAFALFRPAIEDVEYQHLRHELRWFTAQLGDARNLDVYLERDLDDEERAKLIRKRERAYDEVADAMNSHKFRRLLIDIVGWVASAHGAPASSRARPLDELREPLGSDRLWATIASDSGHRQHGRGDATPRVRIQGEEDALRRRIRPGTVSHARARRKAIRTRRSRNSRSSLGKLNDMATARTIETVPANDGWLIGSLEERRHLSDGRACPSRARCGWEILAPERQLRPDTSKRRPSPSLSSCPARASSSRGLRRRASWRPP